MVFLLSFWKTAKGKAIADKGSEQTQKAYGVSLAEQDGFYISKSDFQILKNFLVDNILSLIDNQINKQENIIKEKEKK